MPEKPARSTSQFRGVSFNNQLKKWKAVITVGRSQHFLGYFAEEMEAARAYDDASLRMRGPNAPVNFPTPVMNESGMDMSMSDAFGTSGTSESLAKLGTGMTIESVDSVRDPVVELAAIKATLAKQRGESVPEYFMSL